MARRIGVRHRITALPKMKKLRARGRAGRRGRSGAAY